MSIYVQPSEAQRASRTGREVHKEFAASFVSRSGLSRSSYMRGVTLSHDEKDRNEYSQPSSSPHMSTNRVTLIPKKRTQKVKSDFKSSLHMHSSHNILKGPYIHIDRKTHTISHMIPCNK